MDAHQGCGGEGFPGDLGGVGEVLAGADVEDHGKIGRIPGVEGTTARRVDRDDGVGFGVGDFVAAAGEGQQCRKSW